MNYPVYFQNEKCFRHKLYRKLKHILLSMKFFENSAVHEIMWENTVEPERAQMEACAFHAEYQRLQNIRSEYVMHIAFLLQHWLHECALVLHLFYITYSSEISPTRCNNCVFILRNGFTLHVSGDSLTHHQEYICCIWPQLSRLT